MRLRAWMSAGVFVGATVAAGVTGWLWVVGVAFAAAITWIWASETARVQRPKRIWSSRLGPPR